MSAKPKSRPPQEPLKRAPIPALSSHNMRIGAEGHLKRSWSVAPHDFFRVYSDEPIRLEIEFAVEMPSPLVMLYTDLLSPAGEFGEIPFVAEGSRKFSLQVDPVRCGAFIFKLKYSPDNGATWLWDRTPYSKVIVDPAAARSIRQYTFIPTVSGHIGDWKKQLTRIRDMGFTMVHLLPVTRMDGSCSPYAAADLFDVDPSYLDPADQRPGLEQFEDFVRAARKCGLGLCLDLVLNHIGITSKVALNTPEWIVPDKNEANGLLRAGCWHMNSWIKWEDLVRINYDHPESRMKQDIWQYMQDYALFWANYAAFTGGMVRLDNLHSSHQGFIVAALAALRKTHPQLVIQAELFSDSNTLLKAASESDLTLLLANPWEYPFAEQMRDYVKYLHTIATKIRFLTPVSTHDTGAIAQLYGVADALVSRYFVTALMTTGQTGMVQGSEHGVLNRVEFIGRGGQLAAPSPDKYRRLIKRINEVHEHSAVFHQGGNLAFIDGGHGAVMAVVRRAAEPGGDIYLCAANLDTTGTHTIWISCDEYRQPGRALVLNDLIHDELFRVDGSHFELILPPCGVRAFKVETP